MEHKMQIKLLVEGGSMQPGPALSQKLGPAGININQVIQKVNEATKNFKGLKVPVEMEVDIGSKEFDIKVFSPPVSELLKKEIGIEKGSGTQNKLYAANASIEQIIKVAKTKFPNMLCNDLKEAVKTVIGTCVSLGVLVENKQASKLGHEIDGGKFHKEIEAESTETSPEKRKQLDEYFSQVKDEQEKIIKQEQAAKAAEAEVATTATGTTTATAATPEAGKEETKSKESTDAKKAEKK